MISQLYQKLTAIFGSETALWNVVANSITALTLFALFYQIRSTNRQYAELNRGYIEPTPLLELIDDTIDRVESAADGVSLSREFGGVNCRVEFANVGNLPLRYRVLRYDVEVSSGEHSSPLTREDNVDGIIYPQQRTTFSLHGIQFVRPNNAKVAFQDLQQLEFRCVLLVEYSTSGGRTQRVDRTFHWRIAANQARLTWVRLADKWE